MEMHLFQRRNNKIIRRPYHIVFLDDLIIPEEDIGAYVAERQRKAASLIQKTWQGYIFRKRFSKTRIELLRLKAAIKIQRFYRNWKYLKQVAHKPPPYLQPLERIPEEDLLVFQKYIRTWQEDHQFNFEGFEKCTKRHREVQEQINQFYCDVSASKSREQHVKEKIAQLQMQTLILQDSPSLKGSTTALQNMDPTLFNCLSLSDAKEARMNHREEFKFLNRPWWKKF